MLRESDFNLEKATKLGHAAEETRKHVQDLKGNLNRTVNKIEKEQHSPDNSLQKALIKKLQILFLYSRKWEVSGLWEIM